MVVAVLLKKRSSFKESPLFFVHSELLVRLSFRLIHCAVNNVGDNWVA
jgi:hypothetical protein